MSYTPRSVRLEDIAENLKSIAEQREYERLVALEAAEVAEQLVINHHRQRQNEKSVTK